MQAQDKGLEASKNKLTANGIDLPFPTQQILLHDQTEVSDGDRKTQREGWPAGEGDVPQSRQELREAEAKPAAEAAAKENKAASSPAKPEKSAAPAPAG